MARWAIAACGDPDLRLKLLARIGATAVLTVDAGDWRDEVLAQLRVCRTVTAGEKAALGVTAFFDLWRGRPLTEVRGRAEALFRDDWVPSLRGSGAAYWLEMTALALTESPLLWQATDEALAYAPQSSIGAEGGTLDDSVPGAGDAQQERRRPGEHRDHLHDQGGAATATGGPVNIDTAHPTASVAGAIKGATYVSRPVAICKAKAGPRASAHAR